MSQSLAWNRIGLKLRNILSQWLTKYDFLLCNFDQYWWKIILIKIPKNITWPKLFEKIILLNLTRPSEVAFVTYLLNLKSLLLIYKWLYWCDSGYWWYLVQSDNRYPIMIVDFFIKLRNTLSEKKKLYSDKTYRVMKYFSMKKKRSYMVKNDILR